MRKRQLRPDHFTDGAIARRSPLARLLYEGLGCLADRRGVLVDAPADIKRQVLPFDDVDVEELLDELAGAAEGGGRRLVVRYEVAGQRLLFLPGWSAEQTFHVRERPRSLPAPPAPRPVLRQAARIVRRDRASGARVRTAQPASAQHRAGTVLASSNAAKTSQHGAGNSRRLNDLVAPCSQLSTAQNDASTVLASQCKTTESEHRAPRAPARRSVSTEPAEADATQRLASTVLAPCSSTVPPPHTPPYKEHHHGQRPPPTPPSAEGGAGVSRARKAWIRQHAAQIEAAAHARGLRTDRRVRAWIRDELRSGREPGEVLRSLEKSAQRAAQAEARAERAAAAADEALIPDERALRLWERVKGRVEGNLDRHLFATWFRGSYGHRIEADVLVVEVPGTRHGDQLRGSYAALVRSALDELGHGALTIDPRTEDELCT